MHIKRSVYKRIVNSYLTPPPEQGGIIGTYNNIVCEYFHDNSSKILHSAVYSPDVKSFNQTIVQWSEKGIQFAGIVHSHLSEQKELSSGDITYIIRIFDSLSNSIVRLYFPIIIPASKEFFSYVAEKIDGNIMIFKDDVIFEN